jgi:hypothetical protein
MSNCANLIHSEVRHPRRSRAQLAVIDLTAPVFVTLADQHPVRDD